MKHRTFILMLLALVFALGCNHETAQEPITAQENEEDVATLIQNLQHYIGLIFCRAAEFDFTLPSGNPAPADFSATGWSAEGNNSFGNDDAGYLVLGCWAKESRGGDV